MCSYIRCSGYVRRIYYWKKIQIRHGRRIQKLIPGSRWYYIGYIGILASILILGYYMVISGWTLEYLFQAACNNLTGKTAAEFKAEQNAFIQNDFRPLLWIYIFLFINYIIISKGVQKGIEKMSNILMPILFIILIVFVYGR